jgi:hypothetical protein
LERNSGNSSDLPVALRCQDFLEACCAEKSGGHPRPLLHGKFFYSSEGLSMKIENSYMNKAKTFFESLIETP